MKNKNEFLRKSPGKKKRKLVYDLTVILFPTFILCVGIIVSSQRFAESINYNYRLCNEPVIVITVKPKKDCVLAGQVGQKSKHLLIRLNKKIENKPVLVYSESKTGERFYVYPVYDPLVISLTMFTQPFDKTVQKGISKAVIPAFAFGFMSVLTFLILAIIRTYGLNKGENAYGTATWAKDKHLKKFGLCEKHGVVLCQREDAISKAVVNSKGNFSLEIKRNTTYLCHAGTSHTLVIAPTRSGKGTGTINETLVSYTESMIVFDPKGELYNMTAGYRAKFSHVIKFSPVSMETAHFNPLEEVELTESAFRDIGTILTNIFNQNAKSSDSNAEFFDNNARDLLTGVIFHVLSAVDDNGEPFYSREEKNIAGVLRIFSRAKSGGGQEGDQEHPPKPGEELIEEMLNCKHFDKFGKESDYIHGIVVDVASAAKDQNEKVRADIMSTIQSKLNLFRDPYITNVTKYSDFKISDFYDSDEPISLYLTVPFSDLDRIKSVFQLIIDFILRRFSSGEMRAGKKEKKLKHPILFLLDEFKTLGKMQFLATSMGILAGYGLRFFIVVQAFQQLVELYGQEGANTFLDNCRYTLIYAPSNPQDCEKFSKMMGKMNVKKENLSISGSRFSPSLNNLNASVQEFAVDLMNPDEISKLPYTDCIVYIQNGPPYMGKKLAFYADSRFAWKIFYEDVDTGEIKNGFRAPYSQEEINEEIKGLPSQIRLAEENARRKAGEGDSPEKAAKRRESAKFNPLAWLACQKANEKTGEVEEWDAPYGNDEETAGEPPPKTSAFTPADFDDGE